MVNPGTRHSLWRSGADLSDTRTNLVRPDEGEDLMCWKCDNPDATDADYFDMIREIIGTRGWCIQVVEKERWRPGFAYTVGLTRLGQPELVTTGLPHAAAAQLLNSLAHQAVCHSAPAFVA